MDELEAAVFLSRAHAAAITGSDTDHVLVCGGSRGVLRFFVVRYSCNKSGSGKKAAASHSFSCQPLFIMSITGEDARHRTVVPRLDAEGKAETPAAAKKTDGGEEVHGISSIIYLPNRQHSQLVAITADQTFCCYELQSSGSATSASASGTPSKSSSSKKKKTASAGAGPGAGETAMVLSRQLVGTHDDILDVCCLPSVDRKTHKKDYLLAIASNSPHIRLTNMLTGSATTSAANGGSVEEATSLLLYGHTDIVLALDGSPNGYVPVPCLCSFFVTALPVPFFFHFSRLCCNLPVCFSSCNASL